MLDVRPGDVLFRWVQEQTPFKKHGKALAGGLTQRKIAKQQQYQTETLIAQRRLLGPEEGKEVFAAFTNKHILHVAICGWEDLVWEVQSSGLERKALAKRDSFDLVVRFTRQGVGDGLADILAAIPPIEFRYPTGLIGIYTLTSGRKAPLIKSPARPPSYEDLEDEELADEEWATERKQIQTPSTMLPDDKIFFEFIGKAEKSVTLEDINHRLSQARYKAIPKFICSHFVNAVLHYYFFPFLGFVDTLRHQETYSVGPAEMARQCRYEHGVWKACPHQVLGIQHRGMFDEEVTGSYLTLLPEYALTL